MSKALEEAGLAPGKARVDAMMATAAAMRRTNETRKVQAQIDAANSELEATGKLLVTPALAGVGIKHDDGKPAMHLIPPEALDALAQVLGFGATKYEPRNWERGLLYSRVFAAAMRHLWAWWRGDGPDAETGFNHIDHALTCVSFLVAYERRKMTSFDDRPA